MHIEKLIVKNFKKFADRKFDFNKDLNLLVGDNDSGKSTIQEAIEIALNCTYRGKPLSSEIKPELFSLDATTSYILKFRGSKPTNKGGYFLILGS